MEQRFKEIAAYVRNNVEFYEERLQLALNKMDRMRCSLRFADNELFERIVDSVREWCDDRGIDVNDFEESFSDWDELIEGDNGIIWEE